MVNTLAQALMARRRQPSMRFQQLMPSFQTDPSRILGQQLMQQGLSTAPVRTPLQGLGRLSQALVGAYLQRQAGDRLADREDKYQNQLANALSGIDMSSTPILANFARQFPEQALPIAISTEATKATTKPTETFRTLSKEQANARGLDTSRGQVYQQGSISGSIKNISGSQTGSMGSSANMLNRAIELSGKPNRTNAENQELKGLAAILGKPTNLNRINPTTGNTEVLQIPGIDLNTILNGNENQVKEPIAKEPIVTKQAKLTEQEASFVSDAASASNDIKTIIDIMFDGDLQGGEYNQGVAVLSGSSMGRSTSGDAQRLYNAIQNLVDLRLRKRTGATANQEEIDLYLSQVVPGITTRGSTVRANIERLIIELGTNINAFKQGRKIENLTKIDVNDYLKKSNENTTSNKINLPD
ncbi:MAG: hypothetical protein Tp172SUR151031_34 [Prokaryotic dsDNA virus sp.]|nr:MAG: hypothetical protein Tp172SUR151031_34 [Prokaryotic dsDNA virus sp.]|tara:strand:+ start:2157 stop:3401 length:1245 start_codon:yes stop_codon:yes gene_type:complete